MAEVRERAVLDALGRYVSAVVACPRDRVTAVSRFDEGNRHAVYKVSYVDPGGGATDVVVRVSHGADQADRAGAEYEARVLERTGGLAAPRLYDFRLTSPWFDTPAMCMEFVPGRVMELSSASPEDVARLGSVVAWVHRRPVGDLLDAQPTPGDIASYAERRLTSILSTLAWARDPLPTLIQARLRRAADRVRTSWEAARAARSFGTGEALALLHGDIAQGNVLWGTDPVLIDWEYARLGDPADEIAYLFDQNGLPPELRNAFWRGYAESVDDQARLDPVKARVGWWEPVTLLGSALWWAERWVRRVEMDATGRSDAGVPRDQPYYAENVIRRLDRLEVLLARSQEDGGS